MENRLNAPLPDGVFVRYYVEHPDKALPPGHEHLQAVVDAGREQARRDSTAGETEAVGEPATIPDSAPNSTGPRLGTEGQLQFDTDPHGTRPE